MPAHNKLARRQANLSIEHSPAPVKPGRCDVVDAIAGRGRHGRPHAVGLAALLSVLLVPGVLRAQGVVGETRCGNPTCHGASLPASPADDPTWKPWKSARTQWLNANIDRHSRAYRTLTTEDSKRIAAYMGIEATKSPKCLVCHAPPAAAAAGSKYKVNEGVTCEHCHGPAERWLDVHKATDWPGKRAGFPGFVNLNELGTRADKCASCHVEIDHEIVAGGHPPLQFEMVAYAQVMKHWDDSDEHPGVNPDPTLWALGQIVGLRDAAAAIARRAGGDNYQSLGAFHGFKDANCYQCHHKLVEDAARQAQGHAEMVEIVLGAMFPDAKAQLTGRWNDLEAAVRGSAAAAQQKATDLRAWLAPFEERVRTSPPDRAATRRMLQQILNSGATLSAYRTFSHSRQPRSNVERVGNVDLPWWYTTGPREQTALAIQALCPPAFDDKTCAAIFPELKRLVESIDREEQNPGAFNAALSAIKAKLF